MIYQSTEETVKNVFTTLPENIDFPDVCLWVGTGVLVTWLVTLTLFGHKKLLKLRILMLLSVGILGMTGYLLYQNINENLGGYYLNGKVSDGQLFPKVDVDPDSPGKDYMIYFPGSILGKRFRSDIVKTDTCTVIPHGYNAAVRRFAAGLRPQDRLHLIGFSRGGGEALALAAAIRRPIASLVLADPTADILQALECRLKICEKPRNVEYFKVFSVRSYDASTDSNEAIRNYHFFIMADFIDPRYVTRVDSGDHGMRSTGYRIDEYRRDEVEKLRFRVLSDRARQNGADGAKSPTPIKKSAAEH